MKLFTRYINFKNWLIILLFLLFGISLFFTLIPLLAAIILFAIVAYFNELSFNRKYAAYLKHINGAKFFCYNNRQNSRKYIETKILPYLSPDINIIFLDGKTPKSEFDQAFISKALYDIKDKKGFPYLLMIMNGNIIDVSVNNEFYNTMNQTQSLQQLNETIIKFFSEHTQ